MAGQQPEEAEDVPAASVDLDVGQVRALHRVLDRQPRHRTLVLILVSLLMV